MRPVDAKFPISQLFAGLATRGVMGRPNGSEVEYLVWLYGDYQPYGHAGVDIACPVGTPVRAMRSGTVVYAGWGEDLPGDDSWGSSGYFRRWGMYKNFPGIVTVIKADGVSEFDIYGHQSDNEAVHVGMHVGEGQNIGLSGDTKTRTSKVGPHLHVVTVADPVNYSTDWPRIIFGCVDPTPYFGSTGLVLQGAITNAATTQAQEDDMFTDQDRGVLNAANINADTARSEATNAKLAAQAAPGIAVQTLLATRLPAPDGSGEFSIAEYIVYGWMYAMKAKDSAAAMGSIDTDALTAAVAAASQGADVRALAEKLQITVKEG